MKTRTYSIERSTVDIKAIYPQVTKHASATLVLVDHPGGKLTLELYCGPAFDNSECDWEMPIRQSRTKQFEIPKIPYKFVVVNHTIFYRKNVEV